MDLYHQFMMAVGLYGDGYVIAVEHDEEDPGFCEESDAENDNAIVDEDRGADDDGYDETEFEGVEIDGYEEHQDGDSVDDWQLTWRIEQERKKCFVSFHTILERMFDVWVECRNRRSVARQTFRMIQQLGTDMMDRINRLTFERKRQLQAGQKKF